jgi:cobalt-zinc-cadmium efflux system outer membrane protein
VEDLQIPESLAQEPSPKANNSQQPNENAFPIPKQIPGAEATPLTVPERDETEPYEMHRQRVRAAYVKLPAMPVVPFSPGDAAAERISLAGLQEIALTNSPAIAAAAARVERARGEAIQAGLYPNPEAGYQADTVNTADTAGYHGAFASQEIVTADKLKIAQSKACQDVAIAELELRRAQIDLATAVRRQYFQALIAQERLNLARALVELFQRGYEAQIDLVAAGESAAYEPLQLRVFALEARNAAIKASNDYVASWRALQAVLNSPNLTPHELDGTPEMPVPQITYEAALEVLLSRHTDLSIAQTRIAKSEWNLWLQQVTPIPNVNVAGVVQYDDTSPLNDVSFNLQIGVPLPVFNKNQGNIYAAQSQILENHEKLQSAQNDLAARLAEIHAQYETQRALAEAYRREILPDQVRTYQGVAQGFRAGAEDVDFAQVIVTQQQLGQVVGEYINVLEAQWRAVVDLAEVLQADDLFSLGGGDAFSADLPQAAKPLLVPIPQPNQEEGKPD